MTRYQSRKRTSATSESTPRERATLWRDPVLQHLELLRAQFVTQTFAPHTHDTYAIGVIEECGSTSL
jgi:hypothetical protein